MVQMIVLIAWTHFTKIRQDRHRATLHALMDSIALRLLTLADHTKGQRVLVRFALKVTIAIKEQR